MKKKYFTPDREIKNEDYQHGILYVKLKPAFRTDTGIPDITASKNNKKIISYLGIRKIKPFVTPRQVGQFRAGRIRPFIHDITAYQKIYYDRKDISLEEAINLLYATGMFEIVEPAYVDRISYLPNDSLLDKQYYLGLIQAYSAWDISKGSGSIVIGIVDTGVDIDHPDITGNLWHNEADPVDGLDNDNNGYVDDYTGWDFGGAARNDPNDGDNDPGITKGGGFSHGTGVGGLIGATPDNGIGLAGVGYNCKLLFTKQVADDMDDSDPTLLDSYSGVLYAASMGVDVINCSWGSNYRSQVAQDIINYVVEDLDIVVVAASGNSGVEEDVHYPSAYDNVLSVAAVDIQLNAATFTTYGRTVDLSAPGTNITLLDYDNDYGLSQGTSFSTPMVSGAAGLARSVYPDFSAQQIMELIRVSANDTIYEVNDPGYQYKLGTGLLDVPKALTVHVPAVRLEDFRLLNNEGKTPALGEEADFTGTFKNFLWSSSDALKVSLTSESGMVEVIKDQSLLGKMEMNQEITNAADPIRIRIDSDVAPNTRAYLLLEYEDIDFHDYQYVSLLLNPTFLNIEENDISSSIAQNGRIGYQDTEQIEGLGFVLNDDNILFEMGLVEGTGPSRIASNVRSANGEYDDDFQSRIRIQNLSPGDFSSSENFGSFNDSKADSSASGVEMKYRSMVWKEAPDNQYFVVRYSIRNRTDSLLENFYMGLYADWDVSGEGQNDQAMWNDQFSIGYIYNADTAADTHLYGGIQILTGNPNYYAIDNDESNPNAPFGVYDGFTDEEKYQTLSGGIARDSAGFSQENGADVSHIVSAGPYDIPAGDSIVVAFAIHGAESLDDLLASAAAADTMYNFTLKEPAPVVDVTSVCYMDSATLTAKGAGAFKWYETKTGGEPISTGYLYTTPVLVHDTTFYVSSSINTWESVRTPAKVIVKAIPEIKFAGSPNLCEGDTVVLIAGEAERYTWGPGGETTRSLTVTDEGNYSVTVADSTLGCESTSAEVAVEKLASPAAAFEMSQNGIMKDEDVSITFTDRSTGAITWFWEISDGESSDEQNPTFLLNTSEDLTVELTVTSSNGCHDTTRQVLTVTGLENPGFSGGWDLYPNPAGQMIFFNISNEFSGLYTIHIYDLAGHLIKRMEFLKNGRDYSGHLELTGIIRGLYLIRIDHKTAGRSIKKLIIR